MKLTIALLLFVLVNYAWAQTALEIILLPDRITIGDTIYAVIPVNSRTTKAASTLPGVYQFHHDQHDQHGQPIEHLDESLRYWLQGQRWLRTPDGKFALPFEGSAPFVGYIDLSKNDFVYFKNAFPAPGEQPAKGGFSRYEWMGILDQGPGQAAMLQLFVRRWDRDRMAFSSHRVSVSLANPENSRVEKMAGAVLERVYAQTSNEILAKIIVNGSRTWARIATDNWTVLTTGQPVQEYGHLGPVVYSPDRSEIYAVYSGGGLVIFDAQNGNENMHHQQAGRFGNAFTLGAVFDPSGSVAVVSAPYQQRITLIDVHTRQIVAEYKTAFPLAGISFDKKEHKAYVYQVILPYE